MRCRPNGRLSEFSRNLAGSSKTLDEKTCRIDSVIELSMRRHRCSRPMPSSRSHRAPAGYRDLAEAEAGPFTTPVISCITASRSAAYAASSDWRWNSISARISAI